MQTIIPIRQHITISRIFFPAFLVLLVILPSIIGQNLFAQDSEVYAWKLEPLYEGEDRRLDKVYKDLATLGFRVESVSKEMVFLDIKNVNGLKRFLKKKKNNLVIGDTVVSSRSIRQQILDEHSIVFDSKKHKKFKRYLRRVRKKDLYRNNIFTLALPGVPSNNFHIDFYWKGQPLARLNFTIHTVELARELEELEDGTCEPIYRRIWKFGDLDYYLLNMRYRNYRPRSRITARKTFELYFDHNSSEFNVKDVNGIIRYMLDSNLVIRTAEIEGFASVEGDLENNLKLQRERAEILIKTFEKVNDEEIQAEIYTDENWEKFYSQLAGLGWTELICFDKETVKDLLAKEDMRRLYEPLLKEQRKAILHLRLTRRLTLEEKLELTLKDFQMANANYSKYLFAHMRNKSNVRYRRYLKDILAIKGYVRRMVADGYFSREVLNYVYQPVNTEIHLADFYDLRRAFYAGKEIDKDLIRIVLRRVYKNCLTLENEMVINTRDKNFRHSIRLLLFTYDLIEKGVMPADILLEWEYPAYPGYAFINASKQSFMTENEIEQKAKIPSGTEAWFEHPDVRYYYKLVKQLAGIRIRKDVVKMDTRSDWYYQFDLWETLWFNVTYWDPESGELYDPEITPERMSIILRRIFDLNKDICPDNLYHVAITYHQKVLLFNNNKRKWNKHTQYSYQFIRNYYNSRIKKVDADLGGRVYETLYTFNQYRFYNESAKDAMWFQENFKDHYVGEINANPDLE